MIDKITPETVTNSEDPSISSGSLIARTRKAAPAAVALVVGLAALTAGPPKPTWSATFSAIARSAGGTRGWIRGSGMTARRKSAAGSSPKHETVSSI